MFSLSGLTLNLFFILFSIIGYIVYFYKKKYDFWERLGVPFLGVTKDIAFNLQQHKSYTIQDRYNELAPHPYAGVYQAAKPYLMIRDPELIKSILIKDFSHFVDRGFIINEEIDPLKAAITNLNGQRWKDIRTKLLPTFSSGKLKSMYYLVEECTNVLDRYLEEKLKECSEFDVRELMLKYSTDVIGTCAFGLNCNAVSDTESEFRRTGRKIVSNPYKLLARQVLRSISPKIITWLKWKALDPEVEQFFMGVTAETKKYRSEKQHQRHDFMQLLINLQHEEQKMLESQNDGREPLFRDHILTAHVYVFFLAGFETTATTLSYCMRELALNPDIMEKLQAEIQKVSDAHNGKLDYDILKEMLYMDCVISETLRKYPPVGWLDRICTKAYELPNSSLLIEENTNILIPTHSLHFDPQYFPEPQKFDPDRFNEDNKSSIISGTYLPFGDGPRICIGLRFAMMEIKAALALILSKYTVHPTAKTQPSIVFRRGAIINTPDGGIHLRFQKRVT